MEEGLPDWVVEGFGGKRSNGIVGGVGAVEDPHAIMHSFAKSQESEIASHLRRLEISKMVAISEPLAERISEQGVVSYPSAGISNTIDDCNRAVFDIRN